MARPPKKGLSYFPMDVGFFENDRVFALADRCGVKGIAVYLALLITVYREGYYIEAPVERVAAMIMRSVGARSFEGQQEVVGIMTACADLGLLDRELFRQSVITSRGIQCRYAEVTARRAVKPGRYWLLDSPNPASAVSPPEADIPIPISEPPIPADEIPIPTTETPIPTTETPIPTAETHIPTTKTPIPADKTPPNRLESSSEADRLISDAETTPQTESTLPPKPAEPAVPDTTKAISEVKTSISAAEIQISTTKTPIPTDEARNLRPETSIEADRPIYAAETPAPTANILPPKPPEPAAPEMAKAVSEVKTSISAAETPIPAAETPVSVNRNATNQIKENQTKSNEIKSDQIKSSHTDSLPQGIKDDDGMDRIRKEFESIKTLTPGDCRVMADLRRIYGLERVLDAIRRARSWGGRSVSYVRQILANDQNRTPSSFMSNGSAESRAAALRAAASAGGEIFSGMELIGRPISEEDAVLDADWLSDLTPEEAEAFFERK